MLMLVKEKREPMQTYHLKMVLLT